MKILVSCLNVNGLGGSELYHYELIRELTLAGIDVTLFTLRSIDSTNEVRIKLNDFGVKQIDINSINVSDSFDLIIASQPDVNRYMLNYYPTTPIISIIHSEIRSEDPIIHSQIKHYIAIRQPIADMLVDYYKIPLEKVSLIYNPIDIARFNSVGASKYEKTTGIFVGEVLDPIRFKAVNHLVQECISNDWNLQIMSDSKYDFNHPNISYINKRWDTETVVKNMNFTAGILLGRTTLEGWCCDIPGYMYIINAYGDILDIQTSPPENIKELCNSKYVTLQHLNLYSKII